MRRIIQFPDGIKVIVEGDKYHAIQEQSTNALGICDTSTVGQNMEQAYQEPKEITGTKK